MVQCVYNLWVIYFSKLEVIFYVFLAENNVVNELSRLSGLGLRLPDLFEPAIEGCAGNI